MPSFWDGLKKKNSQTIKYKKKVKKGTTQHHYKSLLKDYLRPESKIEVRQAIKLQEGMDRNEWISMNVIETYNTLLTVYGFLEGSCTKETCPSMNAGPSYVFFWLGEDGKGETVDANTYIMKLFNWIAEMIDNESVFSTDGNYSKKFIPIASKILTRMFRVYAHIFYEHYSIIKEREAKEQVDKCFKHFFYFVYEFDLVKEKDMKPLQILVDQLK